MGERGKRINWASEIEGRKRKHNDSAVGSAVNASPCGSASVVASPVGEEVAVGIGLKAEAGESVGVILVKTQRRSEEEEQGYG